MWFGYHEHTFMGPIAVSCINLNHRRRDAPVRCCPNCGQVVNAKVVQVQCPSTRHDVKRRSGSTFCVDCGDRLIKSM
jgi:hypothetical protein